MSGKTVFQVCRKQGGSLRRLAHTIAFSMAYLCALEVAQAETPAKVEGAPKADDSISKAVDYFRDVKPILLKHCYPCHGPAQTESGLRLDNRSDLMRGGDGGPVIVEGDGKRSRLISYVNGNNEAGIVMPPKGRGPSLSEKQVATLQAWIDQGAIWPAPPFFSANSAAQPNVRKHSANLRSDHWAFQQVESGKPPVLDDPWINTPVDAFVLATLKDHRLKPNAEASRINLIRRVSFDLVGLPPSPQTVREFLNDPSADAYERMVDHLLSSPAYGERWGRHWLDLARYADTDGFELDNQRKNAYKYRDYVIQSFNNDKPYDQFIREQLAADQISGSAVKASPNELVALGFCRCGPTISNQKSEKNRVDEVDDMVSTTASVFLGLTLGCARCHDHKYEPIRQRDYYQMFAVFNTAEKKDDGETMYLAENEQTPRKTRILPSGQPGEKGDEVTPGIPEVLHSGPAGKEPVQPESAGNRHRLWLANWIAAPENTLTARVMVNRVWMHHFGRGIVNSPSNFGQSGDAPTHQELLDYLADQFVRHGWRLKWLHKQIVISATYRQASTFDSLKAASDPQNQWYWRYPLRRLEAEAIRDATLAASGSLNPQMYGPGIKPRIPPSVFAAGQEPNWPKVAAEGPELWRRSIYIFVKRSLPMPMLESFDLPTTTQSCERRQSTTVATQALQLMNDEFTNEQAIRTAELVIGEVGDGLAKQIDQVYWRVFSRPATAAETQIGSNFVEGRFQASLETMQKPHGEIDLRLSNELRRNALADLCHVLFNANEFIYLD